MADPVQVAIRHATAAERHADAAESIDRRLAAIESRQDEVLEAIRALAGPRTPAPAAPAKKGQ